jgi:hypothetical protein
MNKENIADKAASHCLAQKLIREECLIVLKTRFRKDPVAIAKISVFLSEFAKESARLALVKQKPQQQKFLDFVLTKGLVAETSALLYRNGFIKLRTSYIRRMRKKFPELLGKESSSIMPFMYIGIKTAEIALILLNDLRPGILHVIEKVEPRIIQRKNYFAIQTSFVTY